MDEKSMKKTAVPSIWGIAVLLHKALDTGEQQLF
jgi:hypothetical protein